MLRRGFCLRNLSLLERKPLKYSIMEGKGCSEPARPG